MHLYGGCLGLPFHLNQPLHGLAKGPVGILCKVSRIEKPFGVEEDEEAVSCRHQNSRSACHQQLHPKGIVAKVIRHEYSLNEEKK